MRTSKITLAICFAMVTVLGMNLAVAQETKTEKKVDDEKLKAEVTKFLMGKWEVDMEATQKAAKADGVDDERLESMPEQDMVIEFAKDGEILIANGEMEMDGEWEINEVESKDKKKQFVFSTVINAGGSEQEMDIMGTIIDKDHVKMKPKEREDSPALVFKRVKE